MLDRLRLLPTVILCASLLLVLKLAEVATGGESTASLGAISVAHANAPEPEPAEEPEANAGQAAKGEVEAANVAPETAPSEEATPRLSKSEISVLESLAERRKELDSRAEGLDTRERLLAAAEKRVEERVAELKEIEARINQQIGRQDAANEERLAGLVAMYETMKPKDAARIFERLDMGVLLDVVKRMQPRKMAAVLAAMDPVVAQDLTVELAVGDRLDVLPATTEGEAPGTVPAATLVPAQKAS